MKRTTPRRTASHRATPRQAGRGVADAARRLWLAGLGMFAMSRNVVKEVIAPRYEALVEEGRSVEQRMIRATDILIERGVAMGRGGIDVARNTVEESTAAALRTLRFDTGHGTPGKASAIEALNRRIDALEADLRDATGARTA